MDVEAGTVTGAYNLHLINIPVPDGTVIMGTNITNGKQFPSQVKDDDGPATYFHEETFPHRELVQRGYLNEFELGRGELRIVEHQAYPIKSSEATPRP